jgi:hypothetical protein
LVSGLRGEESIAALCRHEAIVITCCYLLLAIDHSSDLKNSIPRIVFYKQKIN